MDLAGNNPFSSTAISSNSGGLSFSLLSITPTSRRSLRKRRRRRCFQGHAFDHHLYRSSPLDRYQLNHHRSITTSYNSLTAQIPLPGPTWSTTAPSVVAAVSHGVGDSSTSTVPLVVMGEFEEILENHSADSYAWWVAFLKSLDHHPTLLLDKQDSSTLSLHHHHHHDDLVVVGDHGEPSSNPQQLPCFPDEWLQLEFPLLVD